jgi:hypothetical protein
LTRTVAAACASGVMQVADATDADYRALIQALQSDL